MLKIILRDLVQSVKVCTILKKTKSLISMKHHALINLKTSYSYQFEEWNWSNKHSELNGFFSFAKGCPNFFF